MGDVSLLPWVREYREKWANPIAGYYSRMEGKHKMNYVVLNEH